MNRLNVLKKTHHAFRTLSKKNHQSLVCLYTDFIWSFIRYGVYPHQFLNTDFHKLKGFERNKIITYRRWCRMVQSCANPEFIHFLQNKRDFNRKFCNFIHRDWIYLQETSEEEIATFLKKHPTIILKPVSSWEGEGVRKIKTSEISDMNAFIHQLTQEESIMEECISNHPQLHLCNALNTIRITTLMDCNGEIFIIKPFLRAGVGDSIVDNYNAGGVEYEIDSSTGIIISKGFQNGVAEHIIHPNTEIKMIGKEIPHWKEALELVKSAHRVIPECRYIGWDVAVTEQDIQLIEGNHDAGYFGLEYFGTRRWYDLIKSKL